MKLRLTLIGLLSILLGCATPPPPAHPSGVVITEVNPNKWTAITKQNILHLTQVYDLDPFLFTKSIVIQSRVVSKSHPVLTLNTRNAENPKKLLSSLLHEEMHWWLERNAKAKAEAVKELRVAFPKAPKATSTYQELLACYLELKALGHVLGKRESRKVVSEIMNKDRIQPWIYYQALHRDSAIVRITKKHKLLPPPL